MICYKCKKDKPTEEFFPSELRNRLQRCKSCSMLYQKNMYQKHKPKRMAWQKKRRYKNVERLIKLKDNPCMDCGQKFHFSAMDYDHKGDKKYIVSHVVRSLCSWNTIMKEINKCDLVCSNCHRVRTWQRAQVEMFNNKGKDNANTRKK